ncbi:unnamed protein product [Caenorhabditis nigoni]
MRVPLLVEREDCNDPFTTIGMLLLEELVSAFGFVHVASAFGSLISESNAMKQLKDRTDGVWICGEYAGTECRIIFRRQISSSVEFQYEFGSVQP